MNRSNVAAEIAQELFESATNAADRGQSQFFTPLDFGRHLAAALPKYRGAIADLNCGNGQLLHAAVNQTTKTLLGADIENCRSANGPHVNRIARDLTLLYQELKEVLFEADLFVLNPPWGLRWYRDRLEALANSKCAAVRQAWIAKEGQKGTIDSTVATLMIALDLCTAFGEGLLIANNATVERLIFSDGAPHSALARHVWGRMIIPGNPMTGDVRAKWDGQDEIFHTGVIYFARGHTTGVQHQEGCAYLGAPDRFEEWCTNAGLTDFTKVQTPDRNYRFGGQVYEHLHCQNTVPYWEIVLQHVRSLEAPKHEWNLWLSAGTIQTHLSRFNQRSTKVNKKEVERLFKLTGKTPMQLVIQRNDREELLHVAREAGWKVQPELLSAVDAAIAAYHSSRAPLYPLSDIMRLGYLDEQDHITCKETLCFGRRVVFEKGETYRIRTETIATTRTTVRSNSMTGEPETIQYSGNELAIFLAVGDSEYVFMDARLRGIPGKPETVSEFRLTKKQGVAEAFDFTMAELAEHFLIPDVPDVASVNPEGYRKNLDALTALEKLCGITLKTFQKQDLARAALHQGLIMGWDTGLGKTWTLFIYPLLMTGYTELAGKIKPNGAVLVVAPGDLHQSICDEARTQFGLEVTAMDSQDTFLRLTRRPDSNLTNMTPDGRPLLPPGFYITSYTQLCTNGIRPMPDPEKFEPRVLLELLALTIGDTKLAELKDCEGNWPVTVGEFFTQRAYRCLWGDEYTMLDLDYRFATRTDLDAALKAKLAEANTWPDANIRNNRIKALHQANDLLQHLIPVRVRSSRGCTFEDLAPAQQEFVIKQFCRCKLNQYARGIGEIRGYPMGDLPEDYVKPELRKGEEYLDPRPVWRIKCIYSPSLADHAFNAFDAMSIDEGVRMKSEESLIGMGVRYMQPSFRNVATATPIKNRLTDIFRLAWWAAGGHSAATARFPYKDDSSEVRQFEKMFLVQQSVEGGRQKATAEVCMVHRLWKLFGPLVLRRRKQDCGEDIVPRIKRIVRCKMGTQQKRVYQYHLQATYIDRNDKKCIGPQLQALRQAAVCPATDKLNAAFGNPSEPCPTCTRGEGLKHYARKTCPTCKGTRQLPLPPRSSTNYIPKTVAVLTLIQEILERNEQVAVFSAFNDPNDYLCELLTQAGVRHLNMDGRTSPKKRGKLSAIFKAGRQPYVEVLAKGRPVVHQPIPVTLAGVDSMAEGHSWHRCNNVILYCYSWAWDKFKQALDRVHRLNSEKPINVYVVFCDGTIDQRLESLTDEKGDSQELVLDGRLMGEAAEEVNYAELLALAQSAFDADDQTVDEGSLLAEWPALKAALGGAQAAWDAGLPPIETPIKTHLIDNTSKDGVSRSTSHDAWLRQFRMRAANFARFRYGYAMPN